MQTLNVNQVEININQLNRKGVSQELHKHFFDKNTEIVFVLANFEPWTVEMLMEKMMQKSKFKKLLNKEELRISRQEFT